MKKKISRRQFFQQSAFSATAISILIEKEPLEPVAQETNMTLLAQTTPNFYTAKTLDLSPAQWIWHPAQRTLPNTIFQFRKQIQIDKKIVSAKGWILGDSRYKLYLNGERIQFGPAPSDPRWAEADPLDFSAKLKEGVNTIGVEVLYYGFGDGTWAIGKPGLIFKLDIDFEDRSKDLVISDEYWLSKLATAWKPGQYKRWYLRSFQEEFDAKLYREDWNKDIFEAYGWFKAALIAGSRGDKPVISSFARDYLYDSQGAADGSDLRGRSIPTMMEEKIFVKKLSEQAWLKWKISADEYFQLGTPDDKSYQVFKENIANFQDNQWVMAMKYDQAAVLTFEFEEEFVGFPFFSIEVENDDVIVELMIHEAHEIGGKHTLLNTHFNSWSKFSCKKGINHFETFDYESGRWLQLHIRGGGVFKVSNIGMRSRKYAFDPPQYFVSDSRYQKVLQAAERTFYNSAQETIVDGMARERQQYSGDLGHMVHAVSRMGGGDALNARFCNTWSQGITKEGYFLDCWPAYDRLARLMERQIGLTEWGPIIDHGIGFNFDCWHFYQYTADRESLKEVFPRLKRFFDYLQKLKGTDGLLPVENLGVPYVWIDHDSYKKQRHKQCAFNLYAAAAMEHAFAPLCRIFGENGLAEMAIFESQNLLKNTKAKYWSNTEEVFINNLPWIKEEGESRLCDRTLATAIIHNQVTENQQIKFVQLLSNPPANMGLSYPANTIWRHWALAKGKRIDVVLAEFKTRWFNMPSVQLNNTLAEIWHHMPDNWSEWSHAPLSPMFILYMEIAGIKPAKPGYEEVLIEPQLGDLQRVSLTNYTIKGAIKVNFEQTEKGLKAEIELPLSMKGVFKWKNITKELIGGKQSFFV